MGSNVTGQSRVRSTIHLTSRETKEVVVLRKGYAQKIVNRKSIDEIVNAYLQSMAKGHLLRVSFALDGGLDVQVILHAITRGNGQYDFMGIIANGNELSLVEGKLYDAKGGEFTVMAS